MAFRSRQAGNSPSTLWSRRFSARRRWTSPALIEAKEPPGTPDLAGAPPIMRVPWLGPNPGFPVITPQQTAERSALIPQLCQSPALTDKKEPVGESVWPCRYISPARHGAVGP